MELDECNATRTPMVTHESERKMKNVTNIKNDLDVSKLPFHQAIGTLLCICNDTRPDLSYVVNVVSRKQANYSIDDWMKIKKVFRYLIRSLG